ncbi:hypothetical protein Micbo1qcDRAFT_157846 [Microdochium bolleyi]|uniref:Uncharacterized protein n=1 Tax=Microdochium bolleyi TaxID=196109 RepID=A0A136JF45_9PEZI|nr:hypothetical protein Micbo1qcDRAFT_157846 [Microdochium bolleyi]
MPGLTIDTNVATAGSPAIGPPSHQDDKPVEHQDPSSSQAAPASTSVPTDSNTSTRSPLPDVNATQHNAQSVPSASRRSESPQRPPYSPITPPLRASELPPRPEYTHLEQLPQTTVEPPQPEPIDFASNPDVLALQSAISILQMQRRKAAADMVVLSRAKEAALEDPAAFLADLDNRKIGYEGDGLFTGGGQDGDSSDSDSDDDDGDVDMNLCKASNADSATSKSSKQPNSRKSTSTGTNRTPTDQQAPKPWHKLPKPQNVVRMPAINWAQYAVVGDSLDRIHQEQVRAPTQGSPAVMQAGGTFDFTFSSAAPSGAGTGASSTISSGIFNRQDKLVGIAAPYTPGKDKLVSQKRGGSSTAIASTSQQHQAQQQQGEVAPTAATAQKR